MTDITDALIDAVTEACIRYSPTVARASNTECNTALWTALDQIGITLLPVPEEHGGAGSDVLTTAAVLQVLGKHCASVPFGETALQAGWLLSECNTAVPVGPMSAAVADGRVSAVQDGEVWTVDGEVDRVPYGRHAEHLVVLIDRMVVVFRREDYDVERGTNLAGEPRDRVIFRGAEVPADRVHHLPGQSSVDARVFAARGAVGRLAMMAGAAHRALEMSLSYSSERHQFGRSLDQFQAVQHQLAAMAGEVLLCRVAAEAAAQALDAGTSWQLAVDAAKSSVGDAAGKVARTAHQIHGAIGFTEEHDLRQCTTRIWSWRDEFGSTKEAAEAVGSMVSTTGADNLWPMLADGLSPQRAPLTASTQ